ncbi:uncharacterized protein YndB with AHSA1/START domain [Lipingzhangella halophila]|uniref:Uncharacterized protein YndB with AHSA1/START domain n=1 Tax=Lipingzhangella halophila TaxID=1783352 RepID=A0A7W7RLJ6_9ACTN|nr:SRPBCC domain-containing protein [Lipingzhangella halophila]MBB4933773.1 uncharacterized protein YndB with AHSA1/START domain [Lipingzhangella halophila]
MSGAAHPAENSRELRFERHFAHPVDKVWRAVTDPEHLGRWYPFRVARLDPQRGGTILFRDDEGTELRAEVTEMVPSKVFAFREFDDETGTHDLRFELEPDGGGCRLTFTHTFTDTPWAVQYETGWQSCLDALAHVLDGAAEAP